MSWTTIFGLQFEYFFLGVTVDYLERFYRAARWSLLSSLVWQPLVLVLYMLALFSDGKSLSTNQLSVDEIYTVLLVYIFVMGTSSLIQIEYLPGILDYWEQAQLIGV